MGCDNLEENLQGIVARMSELGGDDGVCTVMRTYVGGQLIEVTVTIGLQTYTLSLSAGGGT